MKKRINHRKYSVTTDSYIKHFAYSFIDPTSEKLARDKQIAVGYHVIADIIEKNPQFLRDVEQGARYEASLNNGSGGTTFNQVMKDRGSSHGKFLSKLIKLNGDDIIYSPSAKDILFNGLHDESWDGLHKSLQEIYRQKQDEQQLYEMSHIEREKADIFVSGYRAAKVREFGDIPTKEDLEDIWNEGLEIFKKKLNKNPKLIQNVTNDDLEQLGKQAVYKADVLEVDSSNDSTSKLTRLSGVVPKGTAEAKSKIPTVLDMIGENNIEDASIQYATGWFDTAYQDLNPRNHREDVFERVFQDGVDAFYNQYKEDGKDFYVYLTNEELMAAGEYAFNKIYHPERIATMEHNGPELQ